MTNLVTDPPLAIAAPIPPRHTKPSTSAKGKQSAVLEDKESLSQRKARIAKQKELEASDLEKAKLLISTASQKIRKRKLPENWVYCIWSPKNMTLSAF